MGQSVAIVGSGMAGLASAYLLQKAGCHVTVYEAQSSRGMDAHTLDVEQAQGSGWVDVPLRVMSPEAWGSVIDLAAEVGVGTFGVDTFVSCMGLDQKTWFRSTRLGIGGLPWVGSWRYLHSKTARIALGLWRLSQAIQKLEKTPDTREDLATFARKEGFDPLFWRGLVLPLLQTICTCKEEHLQAWPARELMALFRKIVYGEQLLRLTGGTRALVKGLSTDLNFVSGSPVQTVRPIEGGIELRNARGEGGIYDRVVIATQANQLSFLDAAIYSREHAALADIRYDTGELVVHSDTRFMPRHEKDWSALNYMLDPDLAQSMFTVWVNAVEPSLAPDRPIFQTWNPIMPIEESKVLSRVPLQRAVVHPGTARALATLKAMHEEKDRRLFFAGSWAYPGVPLLESAVRSAYAVNSSITGSLNC